MWTRLYAASHLVNKPFSTLNQNAISTYIPTLRCLLATFFTILTAVFALLIAVCALSIFYNRNGKVRNEITFYVSGDSLKEITECFCWMCLKKTIIVPLKVGTCR